MSDLIKEENVWNILKSDAKPVVVYGMGNGAQRIIDTLKQYRIEVSDIFASDEFVRGHSFLGYKVMKYSEICRKYSDFNVVLAFATRIDSVIENIKKINREHKVFAPDVPVAGGGLFTKEYVAENEKDFEFIYNRLADDESKRIYRDIINFKISGKIDYLINSFCDKNEIYRDILKLNDNETIVDLGAYDGDTIREFTEFTDGKYKKIIALEPDEKNFRKLCKNTEQMDNIELHNMGAWDREDTLIFAKKAGRNSKISAQGIPVKVTDIDTLINEPVTMIKMDIEGSELKALCGCEKTIKKYNPKLYICAYHRNEDLFAIGKKILELNDNYRLYFRHSKYIPAWESN
ncbi:MAG: FkbM family methyltransferase, partial [Eubacterium sp.]